MNTEHTDLTLEQMDAAVEAAHDILRRRADELEQAKATQPERLTATREEADQAREECLAAEPWAECWTAIPMTDLDNGELSGMMALPSIDGKEMWGCRAAFDFLDAGPDREAVDTVLNRYFVALDGNIEHLFFVFSAALCTIAEYVMPALLDTLEHQASDYETRVRLADASRNAWAARVNDLRGGEESPCG